MNTKNSITTYALIGLAAGTVAWLLLETKEGRRQLDRAGEGIRDLTKSIRKGTEEGMHKASRFADKASEEIRDLSAQARNKGKEAVRKADRFARESADQAASRVKTATDRASEEI